jgi:hypothetical protein
MREYRPMIIREVPDPGRRSKIFKRLAEARVEEIFRERGEAAARKAIEDMINEGAYAPDGPEPKA